MSQRRSQYVSAAAAEQVDYEIGSTSTPQGMDIAFVLSSTMESHLATASARFINTIRLAITVICAIVYDRTFYTSTR